MSSTLPNRLDWCVFRATTPSTVSRSRPMRRSGTPASWTAGDPRKSTRTLIARSGKRDSVIQFANKVTSIVTAPSWRGRKASLIPSSSYRPAKTSIPGQHRRVVGGHPRAYLELPATVGGMMRRPRSITFVAWVFIVAGTAGLVNDWWPLLTSQATQQLAKLNADGLWDLGLAWTTRLLAVVGGVGLLRCHNWARWLLAAWMLFHIGISVFHSFPEVLMH